jgi:2-dehydro-3-deoxyphosphogluconate aldolase / (4S)-4-hydroxy-2-oxoglutarate aldolase
MTVIDSARLLAIVRFREPCDLDAVLDALDSSGVRLLEVTADTPGALDAVRRSVESGRTVGVGTVTSAEQVRRCADAGARFVVSPGLLDEVVATAIELGIDPIPGALTPTEILRALRLGAPAVKVFPASLGGPAYLRALRGPFPDVPFVPTGGIRIEHVISYLEAGAACVGLGSEIVGRTSPTSAADFDRIAERAAEAVAAAGARAP